MKIQYFAFIAVSAVIGFGGCTNRIGQAGSNLLASAFQPGSPAQLSFTIQPATNQASNQILVQVSVLDKNGLVTPTQIPITISYTDASKVVHSSTTTSVGGVAAFNAFSISTEATGYTLTASTPGLPAVSSQAFDITAGSATTLAFTAEPQSTFAGSAFPQQIAVEVLDASGNIVTSSSALVALVISTGGVLSGTQTVAAVHGVATFLGLTSTKAGTGFTLTASCGNLNGAASSAFNITPGAEASIAFVAQPASTVAGTPFTNPVTVEYLDAFGNVATQATNPITITTNKGATALATTTTVTPANGVASTTTNVATITGINYTLTASGTNVTSGTSTPYAITSAAPAQLTFTVEPSTATAGQPMGAFQVSVTDKFGNLATTPIPVDVALQTTGGQVFGTDPVTSVNGVATFSNVILHTAGAYSFVCFSTTSGVIPTTSTGFTVAPGTPTTLVFTQQPPATIQAGQTFPPVFVAVLDAFGNETSNTSVPVTLSLANDTSGAVLGGTVTTPVTGQFMFSNLTVSEPQAGLALLASSGALTPIQSTQFNVTAALPTFLTAPQGLPGFTDLPSDNIQSIKVINNALYVGTDGGMAFSTNGGTTFSTITTKSGLTSNFVTAVASNGNTMFAGTRFGFASSTNNGATFTTQIGGVSVIQNAIAVSGNNIYIGTQSGLFISTDAGATYNLVPDDSGLYAGTAIGLTNVTAVYASGNTVYVGTYGGVAVSNNGGATYSIKLPPHNATYEIINDLAVSGNNLIVAAQNGLFISTDGGNTFTQSTSGPPSPYHVAANGATVYASDNANLYQSVNGGLTFKMLTYNKNGFNGQINGFGFSGNTLYLATSQGLAISTNNATSFAIRTNSSGFANNTITASAVSGNTIYLGDGNGNVNISADGGHTFARKSIGAGFQVFDLAVQGGTIYAATTGGVAISTDGGNTFKVEGTGIPSTYAVLHLAVSGNVIYAGTYAALYVSTNAGASFAEDFGIGAAEITAVFASGNNVYVGADTINGDPEGLFISHDSGVSWSGYTTLSGLFSDQISAIYVVGTTVYTLGPGGISEMTDGGLIFTFYESYLLNGTSYNLRIDSKGIFYAAVDGGLDISYDGGKTWIQRDTTSGLSDTSVQTVEIIGSTIFAGTGAGLSVSQ